MASLADIVQRVRNELYGAFPTESPFVTQLGASIADTSTTSVTILDEDQWEVNDIAENLDTDEQMLVTAVTSDDSNVLTVIRGWNGSDASASDGSDDTIFKNPRFTYEQISRAIYDTQEDLELYGIHLFGNGQITRADPKEFYELSETDLMEPYGVLKVYYVEDNNEIPRALPFRYYRKLGDNPSEYSNGQGVFIQDWGNVSDGEVVEFIYAQRIEGNAAGTVTLTKRQQDLVVVGATARLLGSTIIPATHDPGSRSDRTVAPGQTSRDWRHFQGRFISQARSEAGLLSVERGRLLQETPKFSRARRWRA